MRYGFQSDSGHRIARRTSTGRAHRGFTLIELLIVVAIILIIAAIAIPNFLRSKMAANQAAAVESVRTITTAAVVYSSTWGNGYPPSLTALGGVSNATATCDAAILLGENLTTPPYSKSGYVFSYAGEDGTISNSPPDCGSPGFNGYVASATPEIVGQSGANSYCSFTPGVIHFDLTGTAITSEGACEALPTL